MKKAILSILFLSSAFFAQAQTKAVTLDLLGSSGLAGVSFDSRFKGNHGVGYTVGLAYAYGTGTLNNYTVNGIGIPIEFNYLFGQRNSHLVLGLGMTNGVYKYSGDKVFIGYSRENDMNPEVNPTKDYNNYKTYWGYNFFGDIGYRFQKEKGFTFGAGIKPTFIVTDGKLNGVLMPYLSFGISF